jgi:hypothetical protein
MTEYAIALIVMSTVVILVSVAGFVAIQIERRHARQAAAREGIRRASSAAMEQGSFVFQDHGALAGIGRGER